VEEVLRHLGMPENQGKRGRELLDVIYRATTKVSCQVFWPGRVLIKFLVLFPKVLNKP
jgi:copper/silver efflux system protein